MKNNETDVICILNIAEYDNHYMIKYGELNPQFITKTKILFKSFVNMSNDWWRKYPKLKNDFVEKIPTDNQWVEIISYWLLQN